MFYDPHSELEIKDGGNLPHWHQDGKIQFATFRLADSLPSCVLSELNAKIEKFKNLYPKPWSSDTTREYWNFVGPLEERLLENGHGSCILKHKEVRDIVKNSILYRDGIDYNVIAFVIMPNHVHVLIQPIGNLSLSKILHSIKRFSAVNINRLTQKSGKFWMSESFDRIVRSPSHLKRCIQYIKNNPGTLDTDQFEVYINTNFYC